MAELVQLLSLEDNGNNFKWKGTTQELKAFIDFVLESPEPSSELTEDQKHHAVTYKTQDISARIYRNTQTLMIHGPKQAELRDKFHVLLEKYTESISPEVSNLTITPDSNALQILELREEVTAMREELKSIKADLLSSRSSETDTKLMQENKELREEIKMQQTRINILEDERASLITAMNLLIKDSQQGTCENYIPTRSRNSFSEEEEQNGTEQWTTVQRNKGKKQSEPDSERHGKTRKENRTTGSKSIRRNESHDATKKKTTTIIAGDSTISKLEGWRMGNKDNYVQVRSFPGATVEDMSDYLKPVLRSKPDHLILHVGTNNIKSEPANSIAEKIVNLCDTIQTQCPDAKVSVSEITTRSDGENLHKKVDEINRQLRSFGRNRDWRTIPHAVDNSCLNSRGLHLNNKGTAILATEFNKYLKSGQ